MALFWEFFTFEIKFRVKSVSSYVYFLLWFALNFTSVAAEGFGPVGNGKVLLNGPWAISFYCIQAAIFGIIIIAAIFGTSILRDFQRDTYQLLFTKPISKFAYLGGRWAGSFVATVVIFTGIPIGVFAGTLAPWADHTRIASGHLWWYVQPFLSITVVQIFFLGSLFFCVAALTRKIFIVYLQGVALFMIYLIGITVFSATRSLEHFWSAILDPVGLMLSDSVTRYWTVIEKNTLLFPWSGVFLINRLLWVGIGCAALGVVWALFPMSVEALTGKISGRRAARAKLSEDDDVRPIRSLVAAKLPKVGQEFGPATSWAQLTSLTKVRISYMLHEIPFWAICVLLVAFAINNGYWAGKIGGVNFVTAHELGHQWWGHQLIGGQVIGSNMMSETLAEYSALEVMEKKYGADNMHKFLKHELDRYLRGRAGEIRKEPPLALVQREGYVWYQKGGLVMYTLANYIGEDRVNTALKNFLQHYGYANANDARSGPYPDTRQFVAALREQTPADMQYLITDMFENIVLYDNKALTATVAPTADKKFNVTLTVQARKAKADENGNETAMPLNDYVDIGVFTGKKDHEKPLYLKKEKLTQEKQTFSVVVDQMPTRAGIDPYNKLVDRVAEDNIIDVTQR